MNNRDFVPEKKTYLLKGTVQNYEWGERGESAFIPELLNLQPEKNKPYAELWIGIHPKAPSEIITDSAKFSLDEVIKSYPQEMLGKRTAVKFGNRLPFLLKVLSAAEALSIQAHPDKDKAKKLHDRDPENYPDDNHKPEIAIALDRLEALVGFNTPEDVAAFTGKYAAVRELAGSRAVKRLEELIARGDTEKAALFVKEIYELIMVEAEKSPEKLELAVRTIKEGLHGKDEAELNHLEKLFLSLENKYGNDVGLLSLFLLKYLDLSAGEAVYLEAGIPHAYLKGNIIECMANSDNVVRAGLTPKFKDISSLMYILSPVIKNVVKVQLVNENDSEIYKTTAEEFEISRYYFNDPKQVVLRGNDVSVFIVINGTVTAGNGNYSSEYRKGDIFIIPAAAGESILTFTAGTLAFRASVPEFPN